jgi:hypothetical protein
LTNADIEEVIVGARTAYGRDVSSIDALMYLGAQEIVQRGPEETTEYLYQNALETVEHFVRYVTTGEEDRSFAKFVLPLPQIDEELTEHGHAAA